MANLNITDKLGIEEQTITVAEGKTYTVDCRAKSVVKAQALFEKSSSLETMFSVIELLLGKKAKTEIESMNLTLKNVSRVVLAILAQVNEVSYEEMEKRFRKID